MTGSILPAAPVLVTTGQSKLSASFAWKGKRGRPGMRRTGPVVHVRAKKAKTGRERFWAFSLLTEAVRRSRGLPRLRSGCSRPNRLASPCDHPADPDGPPRARPGRRAVNSASVGGACTGAAPPSGRGTGPAASPARGLCEKRKKRKEKEKRRSSFSALRSRFLLSWGLLGSAARS